jgi:hypothetical protein
MGKTPPPAKSFVFSDDDDDEHIKGGGIPDFDGWIYLKEKQDGAKLSDGDSGKRKADSRKPKLVQRSVRRAPKRNP